MPSLASKNWTLGSASTPMVLKTGLLKGNVDAAQVIDRRFVDEALAKLGKQ